MKPRTSVSTGLGVLESAYRSTEVIVYGLNLEAADKQTIEQLGIPYVDQRRSFAKLEQPPRHMQRTSDAAT